MRVYADRTSSLTRGTALRRVSQRLDGLPSSPPHDAIRDLLVDWGAIESAVADACAPVDDEHDGLAEWRAASDAIADALCASWDGDAPSASASLALARARVERLTRMGGPDRLSIRTAEGFAHYAVSPEQYIAAAQAFVSARAPASVMCVGLRSIGSILAHVVAAALRRRGVATAVRSLRPGGHPFDRRVAPGDRLRAALGRYAATTDFAVVDEGPGISGSSFASAAELLTAIGVPAERITLFPSWDAPSSALRSARGRAVWDRHARFTASFEDVWIRSGRLFDAPVIDMSAGTWRSHGIGRRVAAPVQPQHERRKYLTCEGPPALFRFAGFGRRGTSMRDRALALHDGGFGPKPGALRHGFLELPWTHGMPLGMVSGPSLQRMAAYLAFVRRRFETSEAESPDELQELIATNTGTLPDFDTAAMDAPRVRVDGRMLPHEWIQSSAAFVKVDALDHHDDHFWPGRRDIAWDVAGVIVEFDLDEAAETFFVQQYISASGDATIVRRLPLVEAAYLAYRLGYASLAVETLGDSPDGHGFRRLRERYRRLFDARAARAPQPASRC